MTRTESGLQINNSGYVISQYLEPEQKQEVENQWQDCIAYIQSIADSGKEPMYVWKEEHDYGRKCKLCEKAHLNLRKQTMKTPYFFEVQKWMKVCPECKAIHEKYLIAFNSPMAASFQVEMKQNV